MASIGIAVIIGIGALLIVFTQIEENQWEEIEIFSSDEYGNYQTWCQQNGGEWFEDTIECKFEHVKDHAKAMSDLDYIENEKYVMTGKYADAMCQLLGIPCIEGLEFQGHFDLESNYVEYDYQSDKAEFSFRLMDGELEYKGKKFVDGKWIGSDKHWVKSELTQFTIPYILKESIRERVDNGTRTSLFVGIIDEDGIDQYYYGNVAKDGNPIDENTIFEIGSISKVFTSLILADMVENGDVHLDDSIDKFLPENIQTPTWEGQKITLLDLATHTSGLSMMPNYPPNPNLDKEYEFTKDGMYEYLSDFEMPREIGSQYEYSNTGGSLLGHVLSLQSGKSYEVTLKERVLDKLGMDGTCIHQCDEIRDRFAKPHGAFGELVDEVGLDEDMAGAGGVRSSAKDMLVFLSHAMNLEDSELQKSFKLTQIPNHQINEFLSIGLGWHILQQGERTIVWHNGATEGFASFIGFDSGSKEGVIVLTNSQGLVDQIGWDILNVNLG